MANNHQCTWQMNVTDGINTVEVYYPLTVEFNITRNTFASANTGTFNIYNLNPSHRDSEFFFQDRFDIEKIKYVTFKAGYNEKLTTIFKGYIQQSYSKRNGVDVVTSMQCLDMGSSNDYVNMTFDEGTTLRDAVENVVRNSEGLTLGNIGTLEGTFKTPTTVEGTPLEVLNQLTGGHAFIDNSVVSILQDNEALESLVTEITPDNGLIGTPERSGGQVNVQMVFNPNFVVGQWINIKSVVASKFTGTYKVCGISHQGTISGAVAGQRTTTLNLMSGAFLPNSNYNVTGKTGQGAQSVKGTEVKPLNGTVGSSAIEAYNYVKAHGGRIPNWKINARISWREMLGHDNKPTDIMNEITPAICQNCITIANKLYNYLQANLPNQPIEVTSGWRTKENNAQWKGQPDSLHLRGLAIDFRFMRLNTYNTYNRTFKRTWDKYTYYKPAYNIIHVQATLGRRGARR